MSEVVKMHQHIENRISKEWGETLIDNLYSEDNPLLTETLIRVMQDGMGLIEDSKLSLGCIPLGISTAQCDETADELLLFLYDRYDQIRFTDKGSPREVTGEELGYGENELIEIKPFMNIIVRPLQAKEKIQLAGRENKNIAVFGGELNEYSKFILGGDIEQSSLMYMLVSIPIRLVSIYGYRIHSWAPVTHEEDGRFMSLIMTGEGMELVMDLNVEHLHSRYSEFLKRLNTWHEEHNT